MLTAGLFMAAPAWTAPESAKSPIPTVGPKIACPGPMSGGHPGGYGWAGKIMVATEDGGVVVLSGNKLYKYDKELKLTHQADLPLEPDQPAVPLGTQSSEPDAGVLSGPQNPKEAPVP